ncbi:MAG: heavy-metal-associated domain-containing protein [Anaerolineae bacterium]|nr:heavy-metal-associated domain-containing protein [Anaerolineae bacterium]
MPGIGEITGNLATGTLIVTYDPAQVTPAQIIQKIEAVGYSVERTFEP